MVFVNMSELAMIPCPSLGTVAAVMNSAQDNGKTDEEIKARALERGAKRGWSPPPLKRNGALAHLSLVVRLHLPPLTQKECLLFLEIAQLLADMCSHCTPA